MPSRATKAKPAEMKLATAIIDALASDWEPKRYHDTYTDVLRDLIDRKAKGEEITVEEAPESSSDNVIDLMEALQASVDEAKKGRTKGSTGKRAAKAAAAKGSRSRAKISGARKAAGKKTAKKTTRKATTRKAS